MRGKYRIWDDEFKSYVQDYSDYIINPDGGTGGSYDPKFIGRGGDSILKVLKYIIAISVYLVVSVAVFTIPFYVGNYTGSELLFIVLFVVFTAVWIHNLDKVCALIMKWISSENL